MIMEGVPGASVAAPPSSAVLLRDFVKKARARFDELVTENLADETPSRYALGVWTVGYKLPTPGRRVSLAELRRILEAVELRHTGWPEWMVLMRDPFIPRPYENALECFLVEPGGRFDDEGSAEEIKGMLPGGVYTHGWSPCVVANLVLTTS